jgi:hypothetical protein
VLAATMLGQGKTVFQAGNDFLFLTPAVWCDRCFIWLQIIFRVKLYLQRFFEFSRWFFC